MRLKLPAPLWRWLSVFSMHKGFYYRLSRLFWQWPWLRAEHSEPPPTDFTIEATQRIMAEMTWHQDPLGGLWDTFRHPAAVWYELQNDTRLGSRDCDEFAILAATLLANSSEAEDAHVITFFYRGASGRSTGHNVCAFRRKRDGVLCATSNWAGGTLFISYNRAALVGALVDWATRDEGEVIAWAAVDRELKNVLEVG